MCNSRSVWVHNYVIQVKVKVGHILTMFTQHTTSNNVPVSFWDFLCSDHWLGGNIGTGFT